VSSGTRGWAPDEVARATAELIFALQEAFPQARLVPAPCMALRPTPHSVANRPKKRT